MWWLWLVLAGAHAEDTPAWAEPGWGWGALPAVNYNSDEGFGFGAVGSLYRYDGETSPYRTAYDLVLFATTRQIHAHSFQVDALNVGNKPLRLTVRGAFDTTRTANWCGFSTDNTCEQQEARSALSAFPLGDAAQADALGHYYKIRYLYPNVRADVRYALDPMPHRLEVFGGWRGALYIPGDFTDPGPYDYSLYAQAFPDGEASRTSVLQAGIMLDNRDFESAPSKGYWIEGSVRGAAPLWGATYSYFGFNTTLRGYLTLLPRLVFADRVVGDGMVGDAPTIELGTPGGSQRYFWFGNLNAGRGVRLRRYVGRVMSMNQAELRWTFADVPIGETDLAITGLLFSDLGFVAEDWNTIGRDFRPLPSQGAGVRFALGDNFIVRVDAGFSALEGWSPGIYIDLRNTF